MTSTVQGVPGGKTHWIKKKIAPSIKPRGKPSAQPLDQTKKTSIDPKVTSNNEIVTDSTTTATADSVPTTGSTATSAIQLVVSDTPQIQDSTLDRITAVECVSITNDTSPVPNTRTTAVSDSPPILNSPPLDDTVLPEETNKGRRRVRTISSSSHKSDQDTSSGGEGGGGNSSLKRRKVDKKQFNEAPDPLTMTMQELIYYNPSSNPMSSSKADTSRKKSKKTSLASPPDSQGGKSVEESPSSQSPSTPVNNDPEEEDGGRIVPQLKIGADGTIQIDEDSMVVETSQKPFEGLSDTVTEEERHTTSTSFRQRHKIKKWTNEETNNFYKALSQVGTDFTMMTLLLPHRNRKELKNKFKKEEKRNPARVSATLEKLCSKSVQSKS
ncbi:PREDICTED: transcription factor TFIIIB component B'' homolog isoform X2 [Amphimedon queenslandica]|uniref:Myb-like domain-containing protein n=1 Tax=Amphimedon queenslandica TaxID=400682 RepID=A0AAN0IY69_AMPQE|nr:PREDICTED: transcription factor TFIIIB component B'' homolog isoform X2 [Amphimedon queenslandica]|eukprot:XP_019849388.1 PREDICTED: transcription factor TFIIIB component B'' homolog isoform X2 [Amphimedon queenslandica]